MAIVIGVRFQKIGKVYYFDPGDINFEEGDGAIVSTARGTELGEVVVPPKEVPDERIVPPLKKAIRKATIDDYERQEQNEQKQKEAFRICQSKINQHKLDMKLVNVEYAFDGNKITFFFTADGRVDFRELVKDLASRFRTRIELRQIGVRDETKMLGGLGPCGRPVCCTAFLGDFQPVSIKMAKEQNLSLNPGKISGLCGRLMCCLKYEQDTYEKTRRGMPRQGSEVGTPEGAGIVVESMVLKERVKVRLQLPDGTMGVREFAVSDLCAPEDAPKVEVHELPPPRPRPAPRPRPERPRPPKAKEPLGETQSTKPTSVKRGGERPRVRTDKDGQNKKPIPPKEGGTPKEGANRRRRNRPRRRPSDQGRAANKPAGNSEKNS